MKRFFVLLLLFIPGIHILAQPGSDGALTVTSPNQVLNRYSPVTADIAAGSSTISAVINSTFFTVCPGDLVMIYQAQGAAISTVNSALYGNITAYNSAGLYEFKYVQSVNGNVITTQTSFTNSYLAAGKVQVIKVPQYTTLTINTGAGIAAKPWKDTTISAVGYRFGGLVVIHSTAVINNGSITATSAGFRGGQTTSNTLFTYNISAYVRTLMAEGGEKGEGLFGYDPEYDINGGRYCRGAAANGGGGGNSINAGGGGGANGNNNNAWSGQGVMIVNSNNLFAAWSLDPGYIANGNSLTNSSGGGRGGYCYGDANVNAATQAPGSSSWSGDLRREVGGIGGRPLNNINSDTRIYFGGGGGGGHANNHAVPPGSAGGGIVYLIATSGITGSGYIESNSNLAGNSTGCNCDGSSGGGAGGSIVIKAASVSLTQIITANGGDGGNQLLPVSPSNINESEGPGGGGGGGFIAAPAGSNIQVNGGLNGTSLSNAVAGEMIANGSTQGATGQTDISSTSFITFLPISSTGTATAGSNSPVCPGMPLIFTTAPGTSYSWAGPNAFTSSIQNPTIAGTSTLMAGIYSVTFTSSGACAVTLTATTSVSFAPAPAFTVQNTNICAGNAGTLTASGLSTYTWFPSATTGNTFAASPATTTGYSVTGTSASGCTASATASVIINQPPTLSFFTASINCATLGSATVTASGGTGPYSYSWAPTAQTNSVANNLYPGTYTLSVLDTGIGCLSTSTKSFAPAVPLTGTLSATGTLSCNGAATGTAAISLAGGSASQSYLWDNTPGTVQTTSTASGLYSGVHTVTVTDALTFCTFIKTFTVTEPTPLVLNIAASSPTACTGSTIVLTAVNSGGTPGYTYSWSPGPATATNAVTFSTGGTHVYTVTSADSQSCTVTKTISVSFITTPTVTASGIGICKNVVATLTAAGANSYTWFPGGLSGSTFTVSPATSTSYTVTGNSFGCSASAVAFVTVSPLPLASVMITNASVCSGLNINLNAMATGSYVWFGPAAFTSTLQNPIINAVTSANAGVYYLLVTSVNNCTATASTTLSVLSSPVPVVSNTIVCLGSYAVLHASGGSTYAWIGPAGYTSSQADAEIPVAGQSAAGNYTVVITGTNSCSSYTVVQLSVNPFPLPSPTITTKPTVCLNGKIILQGAGGDSYLWHGPSNFVSASQNVNLTVTGVNMSGIYTLTVKNASNCAASGTVAINIYPPPKGVLLNKGLKLCIPSCQDFNFKPAATNIAPVLNTTFFIDGQTFADTAINYCFKTAGNHTVNVSFTDSNTCVNTASLIITALDKPIADFEFFPASPQANLDNVMFTNTSRGPDQTEWYWFFTGQKDSVKTKNTFHLFENNGDYPVAMVVKNKWGCIDTIVKVLNISDEFSFYVPNAFTPNNDDINDVFQPKGTGIITYNMQIFDRWGEKLFETKDFYTGWNGSYKGKGCTDDTYIWKIEVTLQGGKLKIYTGYVNLIR